MFGSDQVVWPQVIGLEIEIVEEAPFLVEEAPFRSGISSFITLLLGVMANGS